jgi:hypothetical protein
LFSGLKEAFRKKKKSYVENYILVHDDGDVACTLSLLANFSTLGENKKNHTGQDLMSTERVVFVFWLKTGGPKSHCVQVRCRGAKSNRDSTNLVSFFESSLVTLLNLECRIDDSQSDFVVHIQP